MEAAARYMDDLRIFLHEIREGWRWQEGELCWSEEWEKEERDGGNQDWRGHVKS